jgi:hypothetical protein
MSHQLISRSTDLKQLRDEGDEVEVRGNYLLVHSVPYVSAQKQIALGILVSEFTLAGDVTVWPNTHVVQFAGDPPARRRARRSFRLLLGARRSSCYRG